MQLTNSSVPALWRNWHDKKEIRIQLCITENVQGVRPNRIDTSSNPAKRTKSLLYFTQRKRRYTPSGDIIGRLYKSPFSIEWGLNHA